VVQVAAGKLTFYPLAEGNSVFKTGVVMFHFRHLPVYLFQQSISQLIKLNFEG